MTHVLGGTHASVSTFFTVFWRRRKSRIFEKNCVESEVNGPHFLLALAEQDDEDADNHDGLADENILRVSE